MKDAGWWFGGIDLNRTIDGHGNDRVGQSSDDPTDWFGEGVGFAGTDWFGEGGSYAGHVGWLGSGYHNDGAGTSADPAPGSNLSNVVVPSRTVPTAGASPAGLGGPTAGASSVGVGGPTSGASSAGVGVPTAGPSSAGGNPLGSATFGSGVRTGVTLSSEDSGSDGEVQSTPEGFVPKTPFVGMKFDTVEAALVHYNKYAKHVGFSVKIESSRKSTRDGEKDKSVFVCNKSGKNLEVEPPPVKQRNRTITKLTDCKAKMRVKRIGARWEVTQSLKNTHTR